ncbi:amidinotransferase [Clostridium botulinum]|nr:amidinotransferase [Clostridium botulinum]NFO53964.1 amidinotransferase [Clostridium botulinum]
MNINLKNRYNKLQEVILCYPVNYKVEKKEINKEIMFTQYNNFINRLSQEGIVTYFLDPKYGISQVYTRDIAFAIDDILFIGKMKAKSRSKEYKALEEFFKEKKIKVKKINNFIEGGDVVLHDNTVFVGQSNATSIEGINELEKILKEENKDYKVIPIRFNKDEMLHLDCVFNVISQDSCVISDYIYDMDIIEKSFKKCYYIEKEEAKNLAANFITIGNNTVISSSKKLCKILAKDGINAIYIDYSEIIKGGGAFTCTTLPISSK